MVRRDRGAVSCWILCFTALVLSTHLCYAETELVIHVKKDNHRVSPRHTEDYGKQAALEDLGSGDFDDSESTENDGLPDVGVLEAEMETQQMHSKGAHGLITQKKEKNHRRSTRTSHHKKEDEFGELASGTGDDLTGLKSKLADLDLREVNRHHGHVHKSGDSRKAKSQRNFSDDLGFGDETDIDEGDDPTESSADNKGAEDSDDFLPPSLRGNIASMTEIPTAHKKGGARKHSDMDTDDSDSDNDFSLPSAGDLDLDEDDESDSNSAKADRSDGIDSETNSASVSNEQVLEELGDGNGSSGMGKEASRSGSSAEDDAFDVDSFIPSLAEHDLDDSLVDPSKPVRKKEKSRVDSLQDFVDVSLNELRPDGLPPVQHKPAPKPTAGLPFMSMEETPTNGEAMAMPHLGGKGAMPMTDAQFATELDELASGSSGHEHTLSLEDAEGVLADETPKVKSSLAPHDDGATGHAAAQEPFELPDDSMVYSNMLKNPLDGSTLEMEERAPTANGGRSLAKPNNDMTPDAKADKLLNAAMNILQSSPVTSAAPLRSSPLAAAASAIAQEQQLAALPIVQQNPNMSLNELFAKVMTKQMQGPPGESPAAVTQSAPPAKLAFQPNLQAIPSKPTPAFSESMPAVMLHGEVMPTTAADNSQLQAAAAIAERTKLTTPYDAPPALEGTGVAGNREPMKALKPFPSHKTQHRVHENRDDVDDDVHGEGKRSGDRATDHHDREEVSLNERRPGRHSGRRVRHHEQRKLRHHTRNRQRMYSRARHSHHRRKNKHENDTGERRERDDNDTDDDDDDDDERAGASYGHGRQLKHRHVKPHHRNSKRAKSQKNEHVVSRKGSVSDMIEQLKKSMGSDDDGDETNGSDDDADAAEDAALVKFKDLGVSLE